MYFLIEQYALCSYMLFRFDLVVLSTLKNLPNSVGSRLNMEVLIAGFSMGVPY